MRLSITKNQDHLYVVIGSNTFHRGRSPAETKWDKADGEKAKAAGGKR